MKNLTVDIFNNERYVCVHMDTYVSKETGERKYPEYEPLDSEWEGTVSDLFDVVPAEWFLWLACIRDYTTVEERVAIAEYVHSNFDVEEDDNIVEKAMDGQEWFFMRYIAALLRSGNDLSPIAANVNNILRRKDEH